MPEVEKKSFALSACHKSADKGTVASHTTANWSRKSSSLAVWLAINSDCHNFQLSSGRSASCLHHNCEE
jgi:hypothetical protein